MKFRELIKEKGKKTLTVFLCLMLLVHFGMPQLSYAGDSAAVKDKKNELAGVNDPWNSVVEQVQAGKKLPRFFMTCGTADELAYPDYLTTSEKLRGLGCDVFSEEVPGYKHEWDFWDLSLRKALNDWLPLRREPLL